MEVMYNKINVQRHIEERECPNCGNSTTLDELKKFCKNVLRYSLNSSENEITEQEDKEPLG